jgi:hypothetical protein
MNPNPILVAEGYDLFEFQLLKAAGHVMLSRHRSFGLGAEERVFVVLAWFANPEVAAELLQLGHVHAVENGPLRSGPVLSPLVLIGHGLGRVLDGRPHLLENGHTGLGQRATTLAVRRATCGMAGTLRRRLGSAGWSRARAPVGLLVQRFKVRASGAVVDFSGRSGWRRAPKARPSSPGCRAGRR